MAFVIDVFDRMRIDIATAKVGTVKKMARDLFLIEKTQKFCDNKETIMTMLTKGQ